MTALNQWDGSERRKNRQPVCCLHEEDWGALKATVTRLDERINGSLNSISKHMDDGIVWRGTIIGLVFTGVIQVIGFAYLYGDLQRQVQINTQRWDRYLEAHAGQTFADE